METDRSALGLLRELDHEGEASRLQQELAGTDAQISRIECEMRGEGIAGFGTGLATMSRQLAVLRDRAYTLTSEVKGHQQALEVAGGANSGDNCGGDSSDGAAPMGDLGVVAHLVMLQYRLGKERAATHALRAELNQHRIATKALLQTARAEGLALDNGDAQRLIRQLSRAEEEDQQRTEGARAVEASVREHRLQTANERAAGLAWRCHTLRSRCARLRVRFHIIRNARIEI